MTTELTHIRRATLGVPFLVTVAAGLIVSCSGSDDGGDDKTPIIPRDAGVARDAGPPRDAGPRDAGPPDCRTNPNRCAPMQLMNADCSCRPECEGDLVWNNILLMCEPPVAGQCATDGDCGNDEACLNVTAQGQLSLCMGEATCQCLLTCDPWVRPQAAGCPAGTGVTCTWLGSTAGLPEALCLNEAAGGEFGAACTVMRDAQGIRTTDTCNRNKNFYCLEDNRPGASGVCSRFCNGDRMTDVCADLGPQRCVAQGFLGLPPEVGWCQNQPTMGLATTCTSSVTCPGGICAAVLQNSCSQGCGGFDQCDMGDLCVGFNGVPMGQENMCVKGCASADATGDAECRALNMALVCRDVFNTGGQLNLCLPPCTLIGCVNPNATCDAASGRCM